MRCSSMYETTQHTELTSSSFLLGKSCCFMREDTRNTKLKSYKVIADGDKPMPRLGFLTPAMAELFQPTLGVLCLDVAAQGDHCAACFRAHKQSITRADR